MPGAPPGEGDRIYTTLNITVDSFALVILLIIFLNVFRRSNQFLQEQRLFKALLYTTALIIAFDILMWLLDGQHDQLLRETNLIITAVYYCLNPLICFVWFLFVDYFIYKSTDHLKKIFIPMSIPLFANAALSILSIFFGLLFYIDQGNTYHRGSFFILLAVFAFFYLVYAFVLIVVKHKIIPKRDFIPLLLFAVPPAIGGILQTVFFGFSLVWPCVTLSVLIIYINIQNNLLQKDYLTGLFNRRQLDNYLHFALEDFGDGVLAGIMIDINSFKMINDVYGHSAGDEALQHTSAILKKSFRKNDFIARYGGDEFIVLAVVQKKEDLAIAINRLKENVDKFNSHSHVEYKISLSIGYDFYAGQDEETFSQFLKHLDELMYKDKPKQSGTENVKPIK